MKVELFLDPEDMPMREFYFQFVRRRLVTVVQYIYPFKSHFTNMAQHQFIDIDGSVLEGVNILLNFSTSLHNFNSSIIFPKSLKVCVFSCYGGFCVFMNIL